MPEIISYSKLRNALSRMLDMVNENQEPLFITRRNGKRAVLLSEEQFNALSETEYLLRSPKNAKRLMESIRQADVGKARPHKLIRKARTKRG